MMIEALVCACMCSILFELIFVGIYFVERIPAVKKFIDNKLAKYPDDEEDF